MLKRMLAMMLAAGLCLCMLATTASAVNGTVLPEDGQHRIIRTMVAVGDTVYILHTTGVEAQLECWTADMPAAQTIASGLIYSEMFSSVAECEAAIPTLSTDKYADAEHALNTIFTDGEKLYGYNGITRMAFEIVVKDDGLEYRDVAALNELGVRLKNATPNDIIRMGKWLAWHEMDSFSVPRSNRMLLFNLETGTVKQAVIDGLRVVSAYKDGLLLAIGTNPMDRDQYQIFTYDPETDKMTLLGELPRGVVPNDAQYNPTLDLLVYQDGTWLRGWHPENGIELLGYIPVVRTADITVTADSFIYFDNDTVQARSLQKNYEPEHKLQVMDGSFADAARNLAKKYPDVPVIYTDSKRSPVGNGGQDKAAILTGEDAPDLLGLRVDDTDFRSLMDSGLLLDLSGYPELMEYINVLYPLYRDFVSKDGGIYGIPWMANSYNGWFINKKVMKDMGLTAADIPTNLVDMCAFAEKWNTEYAQKYPHYTLLDGTADYRDRLLKGILELWSDYREANGQEIDLNDPLLKEALSALDAVNLDKLTAGQNQTNPEISDYKQALIWTGCKTVGNWETYMEDFSDRIFIPMTLTADTPYVCPVETVSIWTVNAATKNADYAAALLAEAIKEQIYTYAYALRSDRTEPLVSEYYADTVAAEQKYLEELEARVEESANKATILKRIEDQKKYMETELMQRAYSVTASAVKNYVEVILPACFIDQVDGFADPVQEAESMGLISRYARRNLTMEEFITRMNEVLDGKIMLTATPVPENMPQ